jgi:hypothetical protein
MLNVESQFSILLSLAGFARLARSIRGPAHERTTQITIERVATQRIIYNEKRKSEKLIYTTADSSVSFDIELAP